MVSLVADRGRAAGPRPPGSRGRVMHRLRIVVAWLALFPAFAAAGESWPAPGVREAAGRGLEFLTKDALAWKEKYQCASCHHGPLMIWSLNEATRWGYPIDAKAL